MIDFSSYIIAAGYSLDDAQRIAHDIHTWDELTAWFDQNQPDRIQPLPDRLPIDSPFIETSWKKNLKSRFQKTYEEKKPVGHEPDWPAIVERRRRTALIFSLSCTAILDYLANTTLVAEHISDTSRHIYLFIYAIMTYFMISTFSKLIIGSWHALRGPSGNPWHPLHTAQEPRPNTRTAIIFPVYHEDVARVAAGIAATWDSLKLSVPNINQYDMFLISDSRDIGYWIAEQDAIHKLRLARPEGRFFYRWRPSNHNAKLGNVIDFCRRWGKTYDYMLVMDADSLMNGATIHSLVRMMEGNHRLGILQTNPTPILRKSLFGRMQQFSGRLYGSVFSYSLQAMYMGHASYIGHNALIRMKPFIDYCILPELKGKAPWGGKPLSHDIIEAAMMAKAGYEVWFLPDMPGSYEEIPANILGFLIRERRWMQGNLQHIRFLFIEGIHSIHRENFVNGVMGYLSAPLWAVFLFVSAWSMLQFISHGTLSLGDLGAIEIPTVMMLAASMIFLFAPRILALSVHIKSNRAVFFGGKDKLIWSMFIETIFSLFFSPIIMIYISKFLWMWIKRKGITWGTQQRDDDPLPWKDCFRHFGWVSAMGIVCWWLLFRQINMIPEQKIALLSLVSGNLISPESMAFWFFPILGGFTASTIIVRFTSRSFPSLERKNIFSIPEEIKVPIEIKNLIEWRELLEKTIPDAENNYESIKYALLDKKFYVMHRPSTRVKNKVSHAIIDKIQKGHKLTNKEMRYALMERRCYDALHYLFNNGDYKL